MKDIGSQIRQTLDEAGYTLILRHKGTAILENVVTGKQELWSLNDNFSGYVIEIYGKGYEFVSDR